MTDRHAIRLAAEGVVGQAELEIEMGPPVAIIEVAAWGPRPRAPRRVRLLPVGPRRWWARDLDPAARSRLAAAYASTGALIDLGEGRVSVLIRGPLWRELLARGCALQAEDFTSGACLHARIFAIDCVALPATDGGGIELLAPASYLSALWDRLEAAARAMVAGQRDQTLAPVGSGPP